MVEKNYRTALTDKEWNLISKYTRKLKVDSEFDITINDVWIDYETNRYYSIKEGLEWLYDAIAYPCRHDGLTGEETEMFIDLLKEFDIGNEEDLAWLRD